MLARVKHFGNWMRLTSKWFFDAYLLWIAVLVIPVMGALSYFAFSSWESRIRIAGLCLQLLGLATVARGLRDTRKLFQQPDLLGIARNWLGRFPTFYQHTHIHVGTGHIQLRPVSGTGGVNVISVGNQSLADRIVHLERKQNESDLAIQNVQKRMDGETRKQVSALESERHDRETEDSNIQKLLVEAMAGGLHLETIGVLWLFIGIVLATIPNEILDILRWITGS